MREILKRLLNPGDPIRRFGKIDAVLADGRYTVIDDQGRKITVDGDASAQYLPGVRVVIQNGRIVRTGRRTPVTKSFRV